MAPGTTTKNPDTTTQKPEDTTLAPAVTTVIPDATTVASPGENANRHGTGRFRSMGTYWKLIQVNADNLAGMSSDFRQSDEHSESGREFFNKKI